GPRSWQPAPKARNARRPARAPRRRRAWRGRGSAFLARPPAIEQLCGPLAAAQAKGECEREYDAREQDEKGLAHDVAADVHLVERDQHDEGEDCVAREVGEDIGVLTVHIAELGQPRVAADSG